MRSDSDPRRLFVALPVPGEVTSALGRAQRELGRVLRGAAVAWTRSEEMHLTIRFLGNVADSLVADLTRSLETGLRGFGALSLVSERLGCFPDARYPRVLWASVREVGDRLTRLCELVETAVGAIAEKPPEARFVAHLTIARVKRIGWQDADRLGGFLDAAEFRCFGAWRCAEAHLVESDLSARGNRHTIRARIAL